MTHLSKLLNESLPEGWAPAQVVAAIENLAGNRRKPDRATVYKYFQGEHAKNPRDHVLQALAAVLPGVSVKDLRSAAGVPRGEDDPWEPPEEAGRLDERQRRAFSELIRSLTGPQASKGASVLLFPNPERYDEAAADEGNEPGGQPDE